MADRDPVVVIDAVLAHVPQADEYAALRARLEQIKLDSGFLPPEYKRPAWLKLMQALGTTLNNPPKLDWEIRISDIVQGRRAD
jgi:hypothetical protein